MLVSAAEYFAVQLPSNLWAKRVDRFEKKFAESIALVFVTLPLMFVSLYCSVI